MRNLYESYYAFSEGCVWGAYMSCGKPGEILYKTNFFVLQWCGIVLIGVGLILAILMFCLVFPLGYLLGKLAGD